MKKRVNQPFIAAATGVVLVTLSSVAAAQSAVSVSCSSSSSNCVTARESAATQLINTTSVQQMLSISTAIGARNTAVFGLPSTAAADNGQRFGMAAGGAADKWNVWGSVSGDKTRYANGVSQFSADVTNRVVGFDYAIAPTLTLGVSAAFDDIDGARSATVKYSSAGYSVAPYLGWQINKELSLDAMLGLGNSEMSGNDLSTDRNSRLFYGSNLNYTKWLGNWQVTGKGSYLHGEENYKDQVIGNVATLNSATKNKVNQWRLGAQAAYWMNGVMPYAGLAYSSDSRSVSNPNPLALADDLGKKAWMWNLGVNFISVKDRLTGGVVFNRESGRTNSKHEGLMANINYRF